ncbi:MAG: aldo/keto reductase [Frankiales bacterium]|nr:aldo/keto reductase [Frankiales bacterium]
MSSPSVPLDVTKPLPSGSAMPLLGFGTWQITGPTATEAVAWALEAGYRHLDTATVYGNEDEVGRGLAASGVDRREVFVTTKCPPHLAERGRETLEQSLEALGTDHVDLWLIHWTPDTGVGEDLWTTFAQARADGLARDIGVSNYSLAQLDRLEELTGIRPAVNQVEWSPLLFDLDVYEGHRERGVVLEGYSALRGGTLEHPVVNGIARRLGKTPAQVLVRWHLDSEVVVIPKSTQRERIVSNADVDGWQLPAEDQAALDALGSAA